MRPAMGSGSKLEFDDWEDRMKTTHGTGELEAIGMRAYSTLDFEWSHAQVSELRLQLLLDVRGIQPHHIPRFEDRGRAMALVVEAGIVVLRLLDSHTSLLIRSTHALDQLIDSLDLGGSSTRLKAHTRMTSSIE